MSAACTILHLIYLLLALSSTRGSITAVSSINRCINDGSGEILQPNGTACSKKLVVALTVLADEGKSQYIEVDISRVHDATVQKNVQLRTPVRISVTKSPVIINYRLYQVGYINSKPYEEIVRKKGRSCRDDWYSREDQAACGFQYDHNDEKIFDSQGFCCRCDTDDDRYDRGEEENCLGDSGTAHCLRFDPLYYYVFGLYPPQLMFNITITIDRVDYTTTNGTPVYILLDQLIISPFRRIETSKSLGIRAEYIADFHPNDFMPVLAHKFLLIPDTSDIDTFPTDWREEANSTGYLASLRNASQWLLVDKHKFGLSGYHCNKIGISYTAFTHQGSKCTSIASSCLQGQPYQLWEEDKEKQKSGRKGRYMLHNFGKVHSFPHTRERTDYQMNFIAQRVRRSLLTLSMEADSLRIVVNQALGRILEAFLEPFESLSTQGYLNVYIQNTGGVASTYSVVVGHCSAGIDWIPSEMITLDPGEETNVSFVIHSFSAIGQINNCEVELLDQNAERLDNLTISFQTLDTCFCYGYCGCSCGENVTECPENPVFHNPDVLGNGFNFNLNLSGPLRWITDASKWFGSNFGGIIVAMMILSALVGLGVLKVVLVVYTGQLNCPSLSPIKLCCLMIHTCIGVCCTKWCSCILDVTYGAVYGATGQEAVGRHDKNTSSIEGRRPLYCDGTCQGANQARRQYRKQVRMLKRKGIDPKGKVPDVWWKTPYRCTHVVSNTKDICEILKGLCFFIYCPLLPLWWAIELAYEYIQRRKRRKRRLLKYQKKKQLQREKEEKTFLLLDKYTRGTKEKKVFDFNKKKTKQSTMEDAMSSDSDTSDTDEAGDLDELLTPGYPVYYNYIAASDIPQSLANPGKSFSIKGRLMENVKNNKLVYIFDIYNYTNQVKNQVDNRAVSLKKPLPLNADDFKKVLPPSSAGLLVTLVPLFTCLNDQ